MKKGFLARVLDALLDTEGLPPTRSNKHNSVFQPMNPQPDRDEMLKPFNHHIPTFQPTNKNQQK